MTLRNNDYRYLRELDVVSVFGELVKLNKSPYYHNTLDVIKWYERLSEEKK